MTEYKLNRTWIDKLNDDLKDIGVALSHKYDRKILVFFKINRLTLNDMIEIIHASTGINIATKDRAVDVIACRHLYCLYAHQKGFQMKEIGIAVNMNQHGSVSHAVKNIQQRIEQCEPLVTKYNEILKPLLTK